MNLMRAPVLIQRDTLVQAQNQLPHVLQDVLGSALREGQAVYTANDQNEAEQWATRMHANIMAAYGESEAALFLSDAGYMFLSGTGQTRNLIKARLQRLGSLIERNPAPRPSFKREDWR